MKTERDYVLGTHDEEAVRLGIQHRVWRPHVLRAWSKAGITDGSRVIDIGAGPGHATIDLAEIVGERGEVLALERSERFLNAGREIVASRGLNNVTFREADVTTDDFGVEGYDAAWCRWVASFVTDPAALIARMADALRIGGKAIFHDYANYGAWRLAPPRKAHDEFVEEVLRTWRESGGDPDIGLRLPSMLHDAGFRVSHARPLVFAITPKDFMWQWPKTFVASHLGRLRELGRADNAWCESVAAAMRDAENGPASMLVTPTVLEIIAEKVGG